MHDHDRDHHHPHDDHRHHRKDAPHLGPSGFDLAPAYGHNAAARLVQWQEPHRTGVSEAQPPEPDFDLVEAAFGESFPQATDPTSFLRLARIPFVGQHSDGRVLRLLRVEYEQATDVGALTPALGGKAHRHDPLPAALVSTRRRLRFAYFDGDTVVRLSLAETRLLAESGTEPPQAGPAPPTTSPAA